jgi:protoporphyrinogen oxidase
MSKKIVVLGAGITGLAAAALLSRHYNDAVVLLEKEPYIGGLTATRCEKDFCFDFGSHRLHADSDPYAWSLINELTQDSLCARVRRGKVYFNGYFLNYPPNLTNLVTTLPPRTAWVFFLSYLGALISLRRLFPRENFAQEMIARLGPRIYKDLYENYALRLWGASPGQISKDAAKKRKIFSNAASLIKQCIRKHSYFYYPSHGIGQVAQGFFAHASSHGVVTIRNARLTHVAAAGSRIEKICYEEGGVAKEIETEMVVSTIPIDELYGFLLPAQRHEALQWRALRLLYLAVPARAVVRRDVETYYFPNFDTVFSRVSLINKYSEALNQGKEEELLTLEFPCFCDDAIWRYDAKSLAARACQDLRKVGVLASCEGARLIHSRALEKIYPIYTLTWKQEFFTIFDALNRFDNLVSIGRAGLFLHCNIDHCIVQAARTADFIIRSQGRYNKRVWKDIASRFLKVSARD